MKETPLLVSFNEKLNIKSQLTQTIREDGEKKQCNKFKIGMELNNGFDSTSVFGCNFPELYLNTPFASGNPFSTPPSIAASAKQ